MQRNTKTYIYVKLTGDNKLMNIRTSTVKHISVYGEGKWPVAGEILLAVNRKTEEYTTRGLVVEGKQFHPILGKRACEKLKLVKIIDNGSINQIKSTEELMTK